jgi:mRNA interferase RelE/StbE
VPGETSYSTLFHPEFPDDLRRLPANVRKRIVTAVEKRLGQAPDRYGQRLRQSLHGYWKLRVGDHRVVYEIVGREVRVYGVLHRRDVYTAISRRTTRGWPPAPR